MFRPFNIINRLNYYKNTKACYYSFVLSHFHNWFSLMMALCRMTGNYFRFHNHYAFSSVHIITFHLHTDPPKSWSSFYTRRTECVRGSASKSYMFYVSVLNTGQWQLSFFLLSAYCLFPMQEFWVRLMPLQNLANLQIQLSSILSVMAAHFSKGKR